MSLRVSLLVPLLLCAPAVYAQDVAELAAMTSPWSGSGGELGFASARGNSNTESFNGRLRLRYTDDDWVHSMDLFGLRSRSEYTDTNDDGTTIRRRNTTANLYTGSAGSALQLGEHRQITATVRYERDDFATYDRQSSFGLGYGTRIIDGERFYMDAQIGPGVRRSHTRRMPPSWRRCPRRGAAAAASSALRRHAATAAPRASTAACACVTPTATGCTAWTCSACAPAPR